MALSVSSQFEGLHLFAVYADRDAFFKADGDFARRIGRLRGALGQHPDSVRCGVGGVFEFAAFMGDVPDVAVARIDLGGGDGDGHVVFARILDGVFAGDDCPTRARER